MTWIRVRSFRFPWACLLRPGFRDHQQTLFWSAEVRSDTRPHWLPAPLHQPVAAVCRSDLPKWCTRYLPGKRTVPVPFLSLLYLICDLWECFCLYVDTRWIRKKRYSITVFLIIWHRTTNTLGTCHQNLKHCVGRKTPHIQCSLYETQKSILSTALALRSPSVLTFQRTIVTT